MVLKRPKDKRLILSNSIYYIGIYLLLLITSLMLITTILFLINISISPFHLMSAILVSACVLIYIKKADMKMVLFSIIIALVIFAILTVLASFIYDVSCDGNSYHKTAIGLLKNGWNPVYQDSQSFNDTYHIIKSNLMCSIWIDHYGKASWIFGASVYAVTNAIESGKVFTWLTMVILFCISYDYLSKRVLKKWQSLIVAFIITLNPITCAQLTSYYIDGLLATSLFTGIFILIAITDDGYNIGKKEKWLGLFCCIIICTNIKFTGLVYIGLFSALFYLFWLFKERKSQQFSKCFFRVTGFFAVSVIIAVCIVGYSSYVKNMLDHGNPFYPLFGKGAFDIITPYKPLEFNNHNSIFNAVSSIFSETRNEFKIEIMQYKIPFTFDKNEFDLLYMVDMRVGGYGVLFSGIFLLSILTVTLGMIRLFKSDRHNFIVCSIILFAIFLSVILVEDSWWARYNPCIYILIIISLVFVFQYSNYHHFLSKSIAAILVMIVLINTGFFAYFRLKDVKHSFETVSQMKELKEYGINKTVTVYFSDLAATGLVFNIKDLGIDYQVSTVFDESYTKIDDGVLFYK